MSLLTATREDAGILLSSVIYTVSISISLNAEKSFIRLGQNCLAIFTGPTNSLPARKWFIEDHV